MTEYVTTVTEIAEIIEINGVETVQTVAIEHIEVGIQGPPGPPGIPGGATYSAQAGEPLSGQRAVRMNAGKLYYCSGSNTAHAGQYLGITKNAALTNATVTIQRVGTLTEPSWNWTPGLPIFCGINGVLTQNTGSLTWIQQIALAMKSDTILLDPFTPIQKV